MDDNQFPMKQNINWVAAVGALGILFSYFFPNIPPHVRDAMLLLCGVGAVLLVSFFHTFINHPANAVAAEKMAVKAVDAAVAVAKKKGAALVLFLMIGGSMLGGCAVLGPYFEDPQNGLNVAGAGVATLEALYVTACNSGTLGEAICSADDLAKAASLEKAIGDAISAAQSLINIYDGLQPPAGTAATMPSLAQINQAINKVTTAVADFSQFVNTLEAKKARVMAARAPHVSWLMRMEGFAGKFGAI